MITKTAKPTPRSDTDRKYWIHILDKLNAGADANSTLQDTLADLCNYFAFGAAFVYEADYNNNLNRTNCYALYHGGAPDVIALNSFSDIDFTDMHQKSAVVFREKTKESPLDFRLSELFSAKSMIFIPIFDQTNHLIACVGICDRRGQSRQSEQDLDFTRAVLTTMGTYVKMKLYQKWAERTRTALDGVLNHMGVDVYVNDLQTHEILYLNRSMAAPYGKAADLVGNVCWQVLYDDKEQECDFCPKKHLLDGQGNPTKAYAWDYQRPFDGSWFRVVSAAFPWVDGRMAQVLSSIDITENKRNEEIIRQMAEYDCLTGLPNRHRLSIDCDAQLPALLDTPEKAYIIFLDLDGFKAVNDTMGHDVGDALLARVGEYLQAGTFTRHSSYRYGGDEFVVLCHPRHPGTIGQILAYVLDGFSQPWIIDGKEIRCGVSLGVSCFPDDATLSSELLRMADQAMYQSKKSAAGRVHFYNCGALTPLQDSAP